MSLQLHIIELLLANIELTCDIPETKLFGLAFRLTLGYTSSVIWLSFRSKHKESQTRDED